MQAEIDSFIQHKTYDLVSPDIASDIVECRWIFTIKRLSNGSVENSKRDLTLRVFIKGLALIFKTLSSLLSSQLQSDNSSVFLSHANGY